ncbi:NAD(P)H nitroreductase [Actinocorallia libanotica]|uniref:NAD(P)H nitroreductase n=1 Tax=Actinocorallia libanotica TaxID=46162 RepID=A0ABP4CGC4_9ACTN
MAAVTSAVEAAREAIEAAVWAPSIHNTQPWRFSTEELPDGMRISLHADPDRRLEVADPDGRELAISCGTALEVLRIAVLAGGFAPQVHTLPDPDRPGLLADVTVRERTEAAPDNERLFEQVRRRRTHRGAFPSGGPPRHLLAALVEEARRENASLRVVTDTREITALGALTETAEQFQRLDSAYQDELDHWSPAFGSRRQDGVPDTAYPLEQQHTEPHFAQRDFGRGRDQGTDVGEEVPGVTGTVLVLETDRDDRAAWIAAGQALERVLLRAAADRYSAALHTQALEVPATREMIRQEICQGRHPQVIMRLGRTGPAFTSTRRPAAEVTDD